MPRPRPPLTAREIAAYLCGARLARAHSHVGILDWPGAEALADAMAEEDAMIMATMTDRAWWRWVRRGWDAAWELGQTW